MGSVLFIRMATDSDAARIVRALLESGDRPLRSLLCAVDRGASAKAKQLMKQLDEQLRVICVPGRSAKSIAPEILDVTRICASSLRKVLEIQKSQTLVRWPAAPVPHLSCRLGLTPSVAYAAGCDTGELEGRCHQRRT